uniref:Uncharacterized protein n=1 Tax=Leptobrachium leishanense TaxID=445787 RepID=A0A8C5P9X2_9ANUR
MPRTKATRTPGQADIARCFPPLSSSAASTPKMAVPPRVSDAQDEPCTRRDIQDLRQLLLTVKDDLQTDLRAGIDGLRLDLGALGARTVALEQRAEEAQAAQDATQAEVAALRDRYESLQDPVEDLDNRSRQSNLRLREIPESIVDLRDFLHRYFRLLLPEIPEEELLLDRAHQALRPRPAETDPPRDVVIRCDYYTTKEAIFRAVRNTTPAMEGVTPHFYNDLAPSTLQKRRTLKPLTDLLRQHGIRYRWGFPFRLLIPHNGAFLTLRTPLDGPGILETLGIPVPPDFLDWPDRDMRGAGLGPPGGPGQRGRRRTPPR